MRVSGGVCWVSGMFLSVCGCLWQCLGYVRGDMGVFGDVMGCLEVSRGSWKVGLGAEGGVW